MAWTTPKTDWSVGTDDDNYNGDRFTYRDFNRIKNNVLYLYSLATQLYLISDTIAWKEENEPYFKLKDGYADRTVTSWVYADEINYFEERLDYLNDVVGKLVKGSQKKTFYDNGLFIDADELNRLERLSQTLYEFLVNKYYHSRRTLAITLSQSANHMDL